MALLPFALGLATQIATTIEHGRVLIENHLPTAGEWVGMWAGKTIYSSIRISAAYQLAAFKISWLKHDFCPRLKDVLDINQEVVSQYHHIFSRSPNVKDCQSWRLYGSILEGYVLVSHLNEKHINIFGREEKEHPNFSDPS
jgi:hypothetical protein